MKKNDLFIDVSSHNGYDITGILYSMGTTNTIIKISESTSYINPCLSSQAEQSTPVGFYHFAWFGGDVSQAEAEAQFFLENVPQSVKYLVLDYEDHASGDAQANTDACIRFMDVIKDAGYEPIYYSYKPFTLSNVYYEQIIAKYPNSLWIAGYGLNDGNAGFEYFPSMEGIRWWQYSSNPFDKNIVLLDDEETEIDSGWKKNDTGFWYVRSDGTYPKEQFEKIDGTWYYFDGSGYMLADKWKKRPDGAWYYFDKSGEMATGWKLISNKWYYFKEDGEMLTGWVKYKEKWYYLDSKDGSMVSNAFAQSADKKGWYFIKEDGTLADKPEFTVEPDGLITTK